MVLIKRNPNVETGIRMLLSSRLMDSFSLWFIGATQWGRQPDILVLFFLHVLNWESYLGCVTVVDLRTVLPLLCLCQCLPCRVFTVALTFQVGLNSAHSSIHLPPFWYPLTLFLNRSSSTYACLVLPLQTFLFQPHHQFRGTHQPRPDLLLRSLQINLEARTHVNCQLFDYGCRHYRTERQLFVLL